jgi:chromate reductase, NAD(P)H dehydrogenase (quinone)
VIYPAKRGASIGGIGTARARYHLRQGFVFLNVHPINEPEVLTGHAADRFDAQGTCGTTRRRN